MKRIEHQKRRRRRPYCFFGSHRAANCRHVPLSADDWLYEVLAHTGLHSDLIARLVAFLPDALQRCRTQFSDTVRFSSHAACREHAGNIRVRGKRIGIENHAACRGLRPDRHSR